MRKILFSAVLAGAVLVSPVLAKKPAAADEAAIRAMIERLYKSYTTPIPEAPEDGSYAPDNPLGSAMDGYELPYSKALDAQVDIWAKLIRDSDELYILNSFDWYCQCQDNDNNSAKLVSQKFAVRGKAAIDVSVIFSPGEWEGEDHGRPLIFRFKREGGEWRLDDLKWSAGGNLRRDLANDIRDARRDLAKKKPN